MIGQDIRVGKYSGAYVISVVAIWSFSLSFSLFPSHSASSRNKSRGRRAVPHREITTGASGNVDLMRANVSLTFASPLVVEKKNQCLGSGQKRYCGYYYNRLLFVHAVISHRVIRSKKRLFSRNYRYPVIFLNELRHN